MGELLWLDVGLVLDLYRYVVEVSGGAVGVRDEGLLLSALARPPNRFAYEGVDDIRDLAATYAVAVAKNHPFVDGNKRVAFACLGQFLSDNGWALTASTGDATQTMLAVAEGGPDIEGLAAWLRANSEPSG